MGKSIFNFDVQTKEELNARMIIALFKTLYRQNQITQNEYESLVSSVYRTFKLIN